MVQRPTAYKTSQNEKINYFQYSPKVFPTDSEEYIVSEVSMVTVRQNKGFGKVIMIEPKPIKIGKVILKLK